MNEECTEDLELKALLPPDPVSERPLRDSLIEDGCREPIVVWANHDNLIIDGYNRYRICREENIPYKISPLSFASREDVIRWIIRTQLGRRNLDREARDNLIGELYESRKKESGGQPGNGGPNKVDTVSTLRKTAQEIGDEMGMSERGVRRAAAGTRAVKDVARTCPEVTEAVANKKIKAPRKAMIALSKSDPEVKKSVAIKVASGEVKSLTEALPKPAKGSLTSQVNQVSSSLGAAYRTLKLVRDSGHGGKWLTEAISGVSTAIQAVEGKLELLRGQA